MAGGKKNNKGNSGNAGGNAGGDFKFELGNKGGLSEDTKTALLPVLQNKLDKLIGKDSGYLETLPQSVQQRVKALKKIQDRHDTLQDEFEKEVEALEKKYDALKNPLYARRSEIVTGSSEPTAEELAGAEADKKEEGSKTEKDEVKGIPDFWLTTFQHHFELENMVHPIDEPLMKHITDVRVTHPDAENPETFALEFLFSKNEYFENDVLTKTYVVTKETTGETMLDKIEATPIKWKPGKNITVKMVQQKQGKGGRGGRGGRRGGRGGATGGPPKMVEEVVDSFFHFFDDISDIDEEDEQSQEILEQEYDIGMLIRTQIIQDAIKWFTGEVQIPEMGEFDDDDDEGDDDDMNEDDDDDDDEDSVPPPTDTNAAQPECKQQ